MSKAKTAINTTDLPSLHIYTMNLPLPLFCCFSRTFWTAILASIVTLSPIFVSEGRGKLAIGLKYLWIPAILVAAYPWSVWLFLPYISIMRIIFVRL